MIRAYDPWPGTFTNYWNRKKRIRNMKIFPGFSILPEAEGKPGPGALRRGTRVF